MPLPAKKKAKRPVPRKAKLPIDATRLALDALERIRRIFARTGKEDRMGAAVTAREVASRAALSRLPLPPSYLAVMRLVSSVGEPEMLLGATEMARALRDLSATLRVADAERYIPFASIGRAQFACFDQGAGLHGAPDGEHPVVQATLGASPRPLAHHFGDWLDLVAEQREEQLVSAAAIPDALRNLLLALGFSFDDPIVGRLETGDVVAIEALLGPERTTEVRGSLDRLFDSSGKASLTLNVDEYTLAASLRTGVFVFEPDEVFRWLRTFRDENFFGESKSKPSHPDKARDLTRAPREPPVILRGVVLVPVLAARRHTFRAASGAMADDFYLLGRTSSTSDHAPSAILHVVRGQVRESRELDEPLNDLYVTRDGTMWGLSLSGTAVRFSAGVARSFPLARPTRGRPWWYGIGGDHERVLVWGAGALLEFAGDGFVPFAPHAELSDTESVVALSASKHSIHMLVCGDRVGAVAHFDGKRWQPIPEKHVIDGMLADLDFWRTSGVVLGRTGEAWRVPNDGPPRPIVWDKRQQAFLGETGVQRPTYAVRGYDGGSILASDGGAIVLGAGDPVFYSAGLRGPARLARVGTSSDGNVGIVAMCGPNAWLWRGDNFEVLDLREW
jgi:hypothetical protein